MRRAPIVLTATVLGTAGVLLFKPVDTAAVAGSTTSADRTSSSSSATASGTTGSSATGSASSSPSATGSAAGSSSATVKDGTYTGAAETVRYGTTQVKVTIAGGKITDVVVLQENDGDPRSSEISRSATPTLREEVLAKQTAKVDVVSGATYTSDQYEASLQSALDQAGYTAPDGSTASTDVSNIQESGGGFQH